MELSIQPQATNFLSINDRDIQIWIILRKEAVSDNPFCFFFCGSVPTLNILKQQLKINSQEKEK